EFEHPAGIAAGRDDERRGRDSRQSGLRDGRMRQMKTRAMKNRIHLLGLLCAAFALLSLGACNRNLLSGSKLTSANYDQITLGMSKVQVENILGKPTSVDSKDMIIFKK